VRVRLSRKGDYAVRAMLHLARHEGQGRCKTRDIAQAMAIPESYLPQILAELVGAGLVTSQAGRDGGYALHGPASQIHLLDVIEVMEGPIELAQCVITGGPCHWDNECAVHRFWSAAQEAFRGNLRTTSFAEIAAVDGELADRQSPATPADPS
jgi:Rrf2 family transcriptional regulator, iron-sulfur cluster assembly transcription factor